MSCPCPVQDWPEPIIRVQSLSESGSLSIPDRYIKPPFERPAKTYSDDEDQISMNIPLIDFEGLLILDDDQDNFILPDKILNQICMACKNWGFFQIVNHGVNPDLMNQVRDVWREFFHFPLDVKQVYANSPITYEGYGSRLGVEKDAILDWNDYFFLHYLPQSLKDLNKWPALPTSCREVIEKYCYELTKLSKNLLKIMSLTLGLREEYLQNEFGGEENGVCMRVNFYPKCPQPDLTLGLSSHSDPGGLTLLLPDNDVVGLQVRKDDKWVTVKPASNAFIVNIGDQIQVLSNAIYKSVEHRVTVNSVKERISIAFFFNPRGDLPLKPAMELVNEDRPALYQPMTFDEYRRYIRTKGAHGKVYIESIKSER